MIHRPSPPGNPVSCRRPQPWRRWCAAALFAAVSAATTSCQLTPEARPGQRIDPLQREPVIRVRIAHNRAQINLGGPSEFHVQIAGRPRLTISAPLQVDRSDADRWRIVTAVNEWRFSASSITLIPASGKPFQLSGLDYPGFAELRGSAKTAKFDVINHVSLEQYLPGVLVGELYAHWQPATFMAQAIAARSYAMVQMRRRRGRYFDLESTTASQVYKGTAHNQQARRAVRRSRGIVIVFDGKVVPAFYSSCTGGLGQDAAIAFPDAPDLPPLRGHAHGAWGQASAYYRWGPIVRNRASVGKRIAAWGHRHRHPVSALKGLRQISVTATNAVGRTARLTLADDLGQTFQLGPEAFRHACNYEPNDLSPLARPQQLPSSQCTVKLSGQTVLFTNGRGFGHGVGMGQFGAEAMASRGYSAKAILAFYYPKAQLAKVY